MVTNPSLSCNVNKLVTIGINSSCPLMEESKLTKVFSIYLPRLLYCSSHWTISRCRIYKRSTNTNRMENRKSISLLFCCDLIALRRFNVPILWWSRMGRFSWYDCLYLLESYDLVSVYGYQLLQMAKIGVVPAIMMPVTSVVVTNSRCIMRHHTLLMDLLDTQMNG